MANKITNVAVDGISLTYGHCGFLTYSSNLINSFAKSNNENIIFHIFIPEDRVLVKPIQQQNHHLLTSLNQYKNLKIIKVKYSLPFYILFRLFSLMINLLPGGLDDLFQLNLFIWLKFVYPKQVNNHQLSLYLTQMACHTNRNTVKHIAVVHDIISWIKYRGTKEQSLIKRTTYNYFLKSLRSFDRIISVSLTTKADLVSEYGFDPKMITTIYENVSNDYLQFFNDRIKNVKKVDHESFLSKYQLRQPYILANNPFNTRKNSAILIDVINQAKYENDLSLVFIGDAHRYREQRFKDEIKAKNSRIPICFVDPENTHDLCLLYQNALAFFVLSYKEGFGLPPLEAMNSGTIAVTSNLSSFIEIINDRIAFFINPFSVNEIVNVLSKIKFMSISERNNQIKGADTFIATFNNRYSWEKIGSKFIDTIINVIQNQPHFDDYSN